MAGYASPGTTGKIKGNNLLISIDAGTITDPEVFVDGGGTFTPITCSTNASLTISNAQIATACKDNDGLETFEAGAQTIELSCEGLLQYDNDGAAALVAAALEKASLTVKYGSGVTGDPMYTFTAFITNYNENAALNDIANWSVNFATSNKDVDVWP